jgi:predicted nucleotidyltransferase
MGFIMIGANTPMAEINFEFGQIFGVGKRCETIECGDLDGDGDLDLSVVNIFSHSLTLAYNNGEGIFDTIVELPLANGKLHPVAHAIGDLDGDGRNDLVVAHLQIFGVAAIISFADAEIIFIYSTPNGFVQQTELPIWGIPSYLEINDVNSDGLNDVLIGNLGLTSFSTGFQTTDPGLYFFINKGNRVFDDSWDFVRSSGSIAQIAGLDFDNDGNIDVVGINQGSEYDAIFQTLGKQDVTFFKNNGNRFDILSLTPLTYKPSSIDVADFNNDGYDDFAITTYGSETSLIGFSGQNASVEIFMNDRGLFRQTTSIPVPGIAYRVIAEDFDMDGDVDLAVTMQEIENQMLKPSLRFYENIGNEEFVEAGSFVLQEYPNYATKGDFDGDGDVDLAIVCIIEEQIANASSALNGVVYTFFNNAVTGVNNWSIF